MVYTYKAFHIPSGKQFTKDFTRAKVEEGSNPYDPDLFVPAGIYREVALDAINRWNQAGGKTWKYWI